MSVRVALEANKGKKLEKKIDGKGYNRYAIRTHFVKEGENILEIIQKYVVPVYEEGDILSISEKIVAICQGDIVYKKDLEVSLLAKILSKFVVKTPHGYGVGNVYKMQVAINLVGSVKIIFAAMIAAIAKLFGIKGVFYKIVGKGVSNIDGFIDETFDYYGDRGILAPSNPEVACQSIKDMYNINCMIVDANDLGVEILASNREVTYMQNLVKDLISDNPAGQEKQQTPLILIRPSIEKQKEKITTA